MIKILILILFFITSCTTNKVINNHGISSLDKKSESLFINTSNTNDILNIMGPPSTKSTFDQNVWIYIERTKTSTTIFKLGAKKTKKNNVLVLKIDNSGLLKKKNYYDLDKMNKIKFSDEITQSGYQKDSYVYNVLTSLREKINSPVKRRKKD